MNQSISQELEGQIPAGGAGGLFHLTYMTERPTILNGVYSITHQLHRVVLGNHVLFHVNSWGRANAVGPGYCIEVVLRIERNDEHPARVILNLEQLSNLEKERPRLEAELSRELGFCGWCGDGPAVFVSRGWRCETCIRESDPVERQADTKEQPWRSTPCPVCGGRVRLLRKPDAIHDGRCTACGWYTRPVFSKGEP